MVGYQRKRVALDVMGAEQGPDVALSGGLLAMKKDPALRVLFVGDGEALGASLRRVIKKNPTLDGLVSPLVDFRHSGSAVGMADNPIRSLLKRDSSIAHCARLVHDGEADILVSPGNSGATVAHAQYDAKFLDEKGRRSLLDIGSVSLAIKPGLIARVPNKEKRDKRLESRLCYVCDTGAIAQPDYNHLGNYGLMLRIYLERVEGLENPRIGLLNIGTEAGKGDELHKKTFDTLRRLSDKGLLNFVGNLEPGDLFERDSAEGIVADAQTANIVMKSAESIYKVIKAEMKDEYRRLFFPVMAAGSLAFTTISKKLKKLGDMTEIGGAYLMGSRYHAIVAHGAADASEIMGAVLYAAKMADYDFKGDIEIAMKLKHRHLPEEETK